MSVELEDQIRQTLQTWADEITGADEPWAPPFERPQPNRLDLGRRHTHRRDRRHRAAIVLAVAAAFVVVIATVSVLRSTDASMETIGGEPGGPDGPVAPDRPVEPDPDVRLPAPRYVATALPAGYEPILVVDDPSPTLPAEDLAETIQRFAVGDGSLTLIVRPLTAGDPAPTAGWSVIWTIGPYGRLDGTADGAVASITATPDGLDAAAALGALDRLVPRGADPMEGFDVRPSPDGGSAEPPMTVAAEQTWARGTEKPPFSTVYYAAAGSTAPTLAISATAPAGTADLALVGADSGSRRAVVAGAERVVAEQLPAGGGVNAGLAGRGVAWFDPDGTFVTVQALGLSDAEVDQVVASVSPVDDTTWLALDERVRATIGALPVSLTFSWGDTELSFRGDPRPFPAVPGSWSPDGACIRTAGGPERCGAFLDARSGIYGPVFTFGAGRFGGTTWIIESGRFSATIASDDGWWVVGAFDQSSDVRVRNGEDQPDGLYSHGFSDHGIAFAARMSSDVPGVTVTGTGSPDPTGTTPTGTAPSGGDPDAIVIVVERP